MTPIDALLGRVPYDRERYVQVGYIDLDGRYHETTAAAPGASSADKPTGLTG